MTDKPDLKVIQFSGGTTGVIPADGVKQGIPEGLDQLCVIGLFPNGEIYFASTHDIAESNWLLDIGKAELMEMTFPRDEE